MWGLVILEERIVSNARDGIPMRMSVGACSYDRDERFTFRGDRRGTCGALQDAGSGGGRRGDCSRGIWGNGFLAKTITLALFRVAGSCLVVMLRVGFSRRRTLVLGRMDKYVDQSVVHGCWLINPCSTTMRYARRTAQLHMLMMMGDEERRHKCLCLNETELLVMMRKSHE